MQTGSSEILIGWKSGKTTMGPNEGSVTMDSGPGVQLIKRASKSIYKQKTILL